MVEIWWCAGIRIFLGGFHPQKSGRLKIPKAFCAGQPCLQSSPCRSRPEPGLPCAGLGWSGRSSVAEKWRSQAVPKNTQNSPVWGLSILLSSASGRRTFRVHSGATWPAEPYTGQLWPWAAATRKPLEAGLTRAGKMRTEHLGTIGPKLRRITDILCTTGL